MTADEDQLLPVAPGYKNVLRVRMAMAGLVLVGLSLILRRIFIDEARIVGLLPIVAAIAAVAVPAVLPQRRYRRLRYALGTETLQVVRGWLFHTDTIVPLVRVQHIDVVRGPLDKAFGTASLVVHTAGTHNSIVTLPGLPPERAAEIRDAIREHVRTDFA